MKKNRFFKIASGLLILCLITTCVIGTTLAKYTTGGNATDGARIAKWGVSLTVNGDEMLKNEYKSDNGTVTVKSSDDTNLVAPGTKSVNAASFSIKGTPEVATKITVTLDEAKDIVLKKGVYDDETTSDSSDKFTLSEDYYPVKWTLKQTEDENGKKGGNDGVLIVSGTLADVKAALEAYSANATYAPNTNLTATFELSWEWVFEGNNKADTYLANRMAALQTSDSYVLEVSYKLSITVEQID